MGAIDKKSVIQAEEIKKAFVDVAAAIKVTTDNVIDLTNESLKMAAALKSGNIADLTKATKQYSITVESQLSAEREVIKLEQDKLALSEAVRKAEISKRKEAEKQANQLAKSTSLYAQHSKALTDSRNKAKELALQYGENSKQFKAAAKEVAALDSKLKSIDAKLGQHQRNVGNYASGWKKLGAGLLGAFGITTGLAGVVSAMKKAHELSVQFEKGLSSLSSITGLAGKQLQQLGKMARNMSKEYGISAVDTLKAMELIGSAKPELLENSAALADVTEKAIVLAQAAGMELPEAASSLTSIMNQMRIGAEGSANAINVLAAGSKAGAAPISYLASAIEKTGTTANMMGMSIEQVTGAIESIAPFYKEASMAGNSFDKVLLKLKANQIGYKDGVFDLNRAIDELRVKYTNGTTAADIFGVEHSKMGELLVQNQKSFNDLTAAVSGTNTAYEQATINTDNYAGASARLAAKWDDLMISFGNTKAATGLINQLSKALDALAWGLMSQSDKTASKADELFKAIAPKDAKTKEEQINGFTRSLKYLREEQNKVLTSIEDIQKAGGTMSDKVVDILGFGLVSNESENKVEALHKQASMLQATITKVNDEIARIKAIPSASDVITGEATVGGGTETGTRKATTERMDFITPLKAQVDEIEEVRADSALVEANAAAASVQMTKDTEEAKTAKIAEEETKRQQIREASAEFAAEAITGVTDLMFENAATRRNDEMAAEMEAFDTRLANEKLDDEQRAELEKQRDKRQKKLRRDAAKAEKQEALFKIGISTGVAIMSAWTNPWTAPFTIPFIIASGALQMGLVAARKIPEYFRGTTNHPGGPALVGDGGGGAEMVIEPSGSKYLTPSTDTIMDLPKGSQVIPGKDVADKLTELTREEMVRLSLGMPKQNAQNDYMAKLIAEEIKTRKAIVAAVNNNKPQDIRAAVAFETKLWSKKQ